MAENENVIKNEVQPEPSKPSKGAKVGAAIKEWFRKQAVALKRAPQRIPLVYMVIVTVIWLIWLFTFSEAVGEVRDGVNWVGISIFAITLLSILILALFLSAFPKRKKPNMVFVGLLFVFLIVIILFDVLYYHQMSTYFAIQDEATFFDGKPYLKGSLTLAIAYIVLNCVSIVLLATLPLYKKLILKINTRKEIEENKITEAIETEEE